MNKKVLYEKNGCKLYAVVTTEASMQRVAVTVYEMNEQGRMSVPITLKRSEIMKKSSKLSDLLDFGICLTEEELNTVIEQCLKLLDSEKVHTNVDERSTIEEIYYAFCKYAKRSDLKEIFVTNNLRLMPQAVVSNNFLDIQTKAFEGILEEIEETAGYRKLEILKAFKLMGVLQTDKDRAYDKKVTVNGKKINCYRITVSELTENEENKKEEGETEKNE